MRGVGDPWGKYLESSSYYIINLCRLHLSLNNTIFVVDILCVKLFMADCKRAMAGHCFQKVTVIPIIFIQNQIQVL